MHVVSWDDTHQCFWSVMYQMSPAVTTKQGGMFISAFPPLLQALQDLSQASCVTDMDYPSPELLAVRAVLDYIRTQWPYWDANGGKDHVWTFSGDHGFCGNAMAGPTPGLIASSVILTQWGLMNFETHCDMEQRLTRFGDCGDRKLIKRMAAKGQIRLDRLPCFNPYKVGQLIYRSL